MFLPPIVFFEVIVMKDRVYTEMRKRFMKAAKAQRKPLLGHFELTARCNLDCKMCYVHTQNNAEALRRELSTEQWKRIFDEAMACDMMYATLSGGECLVRKDFKELYLHLWNKKVMITVMTNGTLLDDDYVEFFKTYTPDMVQISIYGSDEAGYLALAGHKGFEKATKAVAALQEAGIDVRVAVTPSRYMTDDFIRTLKLCKDRGFDVSLTDITLVPNRDNPEKDDYFLTEDEIVDLMTQRAELFGFLNPVDSVPETCGPMTELPEKGLKCNAGNCLATVIWDGTMYPCANAMVGGGASLLEMSYAEAWEKTKAAADSVVQAVECVGCAYAKACPQCPSYRLKDLQCGHCRPEVCSLYKRLVRAGVRPLT